MTTRELAVQLHGQDAGALLRLPDGRIMFVFDPGYAARADRPTLSLSFESGTGEVHPGPKSATGGGRAPPYFANLLPEGHLRNYIAARAGVSGRSEFPLLELLGGDLPGAIEIGSAPAGDEPAAAPGTGDAVADPAGVLRFSLAGVQLKFSAVMETSGGLTIPASGIGGHWIVKLPSPVYEGVPENEFSAMTMAAMCGIETPEVRLVRVADIRGLPPDLIPGPMAGRHALAVRRFDRGGDGARTHTEDFAQVFRQYPDSKYEGFTYGDIGRVLAIYAGDASVEEFARRLIYCAMTGNADMHLKNWSLIYRDTRTPAMAPAYDLLCTTAFIPDNSMALRLGGAKHWHQLTLDEFAALGESALVGAQAVVRAVTETVERFRDAWSVERAHLPVSRSMIEAVDRQLDIVPAVSRPAGARGRLGRRRASRAAAASQSSRGASGRKP